ncbi:glycosyl-4,4'-diaponeurosporenoate acyltransferase CrtO family protein [Brumimicrobium mesophilum]|uniref:glycosyl-4,4'-diaponeurosporenoate acyltransferase CrtO family protein n=1 Tax=Brumimicrobium mesophilum TaxID=392717 RepID=UPI001F1BEA7D|nr:hypothetical protein [Brumimicrobium mesophilum]
MKILKKIIFPILSLFLIFRTKELIELLISTQPKEHLFGFQLFYSFLITLFITGIFAFIGFAYPTNKLLPYRYYNIKNPVTLKKVSRTLGVKYFQILLMLAFWGSKKNRKKYFDGTKSGLKNFIYQTKQSEFGHFGAFIGIITISIILIFHGYYNIVIAMTIINIIGNLYPILLQRLHRERISKVIKDSI